MTRCPLPVRPVWHAVECRYQSPVLAACLLTCLIVSSRVVPAAEPPLGYNRDIRPILAEHCFACHGADSAARKADLRLDERESALDFAAIVPGQPQESELLNRINTSDPELVMPPAAIKKRLTDEERALLEQWIAAGAEYEPHWSFIRPVQHVLPAVKQSGWVKNAIDRFVLAELEAQGLAPAPEAPPETLFRRLHLDITGLPPAPADVAAFVTDYRGDPDATLSRWIDRLMNSTAWGEHRARYWLDAARYGDTHGMHFDNYREMWPYRDWVIRAFNANQPFDQFIVDQIAGDLVEQPTTEQLIATGFQRCNITTNEGGTIDEENMALYAADRVQTLGWVFLGLTTNCAQCHDHKFDPLTMRDYYSMAAFFRNTTQPAKDGNVKDGRGPAILVPQAEDRRRWEELPAEIDAAQQQRERRRESAQADYQQWLSETSSNDLEQELPSEQLVVHVPLTEGQGQTVANATGTPASFAATGEVSWTSDGKLGPAPVMKAGGTFDLGSLGDYEKQQPFSYGAWVKAANNNGSGGIIARMDEQKNFRGWDLWHNGNSFSVHMIDAWPDNALKVSTTANSVRSGQWQHVFVTYDGSASPAGVKIYVDGQEASLRTDTNTLKADASIRTETPLRIGQRSGTQVFQGGAVQDVRLYERALSADEVRALASLAPIRMLLATPAEERSEEQTAALFDHYLTTRDEAYRSLTAQVQRLEAEQQAIRDRSPITLVQEERKDTPPMAHMLMRGQYDMPGEQVAAATPAFLHPLPEGAPANRLGLAQWLVARDNPLTARVTVNRFWQQIFGNGLVATPEDFGVMGAQPSHPELIDWLAIDFQQSNWDVKRFFKQLLSSATYRQSAVTTPAKLEADRNNLYLSRGPRFRMDAEMVRDYALAVSGLLSDQMFGPSVRPYQPEGIWDIVGLPGGDTRNYVQDTGANLYRRTLYTFWKRMAPPPNLEAFNAPSREVCTVRRERTNTPLQALVTLNDPQFVEAARRLAELALESASGDSSQLINTIASRVLGRALHDTELEIALDSSQELLEYYRAHPDDAQALVAVGASQPNPKLDTAELAAWTMLCNEFLNLDEALNK